MTTNNGQGGTPANTDKTYTQEEVSQLIKAAEEKGKTEAWRHHQSVADRNVSTARQAVQSETEMLRARVRELEAAELSRLSPEEQTREMFKRLSERLDQSGNVSKGTPPVNEPIRETTSNPSDSGAVDKAAREAISRALQANGVDPSKVRWADDKQGEDALKEFIASVVAEAKGGISNPASQGITQGDSEKDKQDSSNDRSDTTRSVGGGTFDVTKDDPKAIIASQPWKPIRGYRGD